jgi:hypothetical protein
MTWKEDPDIGGKVNKMAILKISVLVIVVLGASHMSDFTPLPDYPQGWLIKQWTVDVLEFSNNSTVWDDYQTMTKMMYVVIPMFYLGLFFLWFLLIRRFRRKILYVNGVKFGTVMWIHRYRRGHIYDMACLLNGGHHFKDISDFPRPISGTFMKESMVVYYRPFFIHNPAEWFRMIVDECMIYNWGVQVLVPLNDSKPINVYSTRITDPKRPMIVYSDLRNDSKLVHEDLDLAILTENHIGTQEQMIRNTWRMGRAEPGTALSILAKASYSIPDRTLRRFWEKLPDNDQETIKEDWKNG